VQGSSHDSVSVQFAGFLWLLQMYDSCDIALVLTERCAHNAFCTKHK